MGCINSFIQDIYLLFLPSVVADQFYKDTAADICSPYAVSALFQFNKCLGKFIAYWYHHPAADCKLINQGFWNVRGACCYNYCIIRCMLYPSVCPVKYLYGYIQIAERVKPVPRLYCKGFNPLN